MVYHVKRNITIERKKVAIVIESYESKEKAETVLSRLQLGGDISFFVEEEKAKLEKQPEFPGNTCGHNDCPGHQTNNCDPGNCIYCCAGGCDDAKRAKKKYGLFTFLNDTSVLDYKAHCTDPDCPSAHPSPSHPSPPLNAMTVLVNQGAIAMNDFLSLQNQQQPTRVMTVSRILLHTPTASCACVQCRSNN